MTNIYLREEKELFYIYTGPWRENAAGVKVLHYLCNSLNESGHEAYLVLSNGSRRNQLSNPNLNTPVLSQVNADLHFQAKRYPKVVYSETIPGNPLNADCIIRYYLNYPGALGGTKDFDDSEMRLAYTKNIAASLQGSNPVLFLPAVNVNELPEPVRTKASYGLYYAGKYKAFVGNPPLPEGLDVREIPRINSKQQSRAELLNLLGRAKFLILFENSTLATEAILMNTPVVFIENRFLGIVIAEQELGREGTCFGFSDDGLDYATKTLPLAKLAYFQAISEFEAQLRKFTDQVDRFFKPIEERNLARIVVPRLGKGFSLHKFRLFSAIYRNLGLRNSLRITWVLNRKSRMQIRKE